LSGDRLHTTKIQGKSRVFLSQQKYGSHTKDIEH